MSLRIIRSELPDPKSYAYAIIATLGSSWYEDGLNAQDIADIILGKAHEVVALLHYLERQGMVEAAALSSNQAKTGWVLTPRARELWAAREETLERWPSKTPGSAPSAASAR